MHIAKHGHACVEVTADDVRVLIDPGAFTDNAADLVETADAILITHEHFDHVDPALITDALERRPDLTVYCPPSLEHAFGGHADRVHSVSHGDAFEAAGVPVTVFGRKHALIHVEIPVIDNVGYLLANNIFHPGDSYFVPDATVQTLLVPVSGPWTHMGTAVDFVRAVAPRRSVAIHDALLAPAGFGLLQNFLGENGLGGAPLEVPAVGEGLDV